jgi:small subunit ribosomal protein S20
LPNRKKNPSAEKALRRDARKAVYRGTVRTRARTEVKKARALITSGKLVDAEKALQEAISALDKAAEKGVIHKNNAARRKARLMTALNRARAA